VTLSASTQWPEAEAVAIYSLDMKVFGRAKGSKGPSLSAYRSGERVRDERTGRTYDHTDRQDVIHKEILLPARFAGADMSWTADRSTLWSTAELAEKRKDARVAREFMIALPAELTRTQQVDVTRRFAQGLAERYGFAVDVAVHAPRNYRGSDPRNFHAHLLTTTREVSHEGLGRKTTFDLSDSARRGRGLGRVVEELFYVRQSWAEVANAALASAHVAARIDHRTLEAQGIAREPTLRIPRAAYEIERRGGHSFAAERIREDRRARHEAQRAASEFRDLARESAEKWVEYQREKEKSGEREPTAEESAKKWARYLGDVEKFGEARAAKIHLQKTPVAGRDHDFGL
jgi:ATP-dependent exoDNAse (exonuclease V) alpha subunit